MGWLFSFAGRLGRGGLWLGALAAIVISIIGMIAATVLMGPIYQMYNADGSIAAPETITDPATVQLVWNMPAVAVYGVFGLLATWISLATSVQRAHDRGKSGWWVLITLIPIVGAIWWLVDLGILEGQDGPNKYGPDPRQTAAA